MLVCFCLLLCLFMESCANPYEQTVSVQESASLKEGKSFIGQKDFETNLYFEGSIKPMPTNVSFDCYEDTDGNQYYFKPGTDIFSGYDKKDAYQRHENPISQEEAIAFAEKYLSEMIEEFDEYTFFECTYMDFFYSYFITFNNRIADIPTEDFLRVYVHADGEIHFCSAHNRGKFQNVKIDQKKIPAYTDAEKKGQEFLSMNETGLFLVRYQFIKDEQGVEKTYTVKTYCLDKF